MHAGASKSLFMRDRIHRKHSIVYPQYLCINAGTLQEDFETIGDWTSTLGNAPTADAVNYKTGSGSIRVDTTGYSTTSFQKTVSWNLSSVQNDAMEIWIRWTSANELNPGNHIYLDLSADAAFANMFTATIDLSYPQYAGAELSKTDTPWRLVRLGKTDWSTTGSITWSDTIIRFRIRANMTSARNHVYNFDSFKVGVQYYPAAFLQHDDGEGNYFNSYGTHEFSIRGIPYTIGVRGNTLDTVGKTSSADLRNMQYRHRATVISHSYDHDWTSDTQAEVETDIQTVADQMTLAGVGKHGLDYVIYPSGGYTTNIKAAMIAKGIKSGRGSYGAYDAALPTHMASDGGYWSLSALANSCQNIYYVQARSIEIEVTSTMAETEITRAISKQVIYSAYYHQTLEGDTTITPEYFWNAFRLGKLLDVCIKYRVPILSYHDLYMLTQGPWRVYVPW